MDLSEVLTVSMVREMCRSGEARRLRKARRLSLAEVAAPVGTSVAVLARWEVGTSRPRADFALRYGRVLAELAALDHLPDEASAEGA